MRRHVVGSLGRVGEHGIAVRHELAHEGLEIVSHGRVRIFTKHQGGAGMADEQMAQAGSDAGLGNASLHIASQVVGPATARSDADFRLADHGRYGSP